MADYNKWLHFRTTAKLNDVSSFEELLRIEENLISLAETEEIKELVQRRSLLSYKLYELEVNKLFNKNLAHFTNNVPSALHDFLRLRSLHKALRDITSKHRDQRALIGLPTTVPQGLMSGPVLINKD
ncbi:putative LRR receptor-like serine/threonine-protein kinase [Dorcoceras hygrometricum]|uniref:Putative LRR receptor-like serine/threonine-protein kinase n=1 Tax=Dorcoceras hygrometricum TaxID=472368 RepID=A0A2Z7BJV4_9LAMI|nr:putative LRR receptor-like serine/threonine-protein kinase [Dorcoceras hygrometricum]